MDPVEFRRSLLSQAAALVVGAGCRGSQGELGRTAGGAFPRRGADVGLRYLSRSGRRDFLEGDKLKVHRIVCAVDCGQMVNPGIVQAQAEGGIIFGLTAALFSEINVVNGKVQEQNFDKYRLLRINEAPTIEIHLLNSDEKPGGMGEPTVALVAPAVCNAIYAATKKRLRKLPITKQGFMV